MPKSKVMEDDDFVKMLAKRHRPFCRDLNSSSGSEVDDDDDDDDDDSDEENDDALLCFVGFSELAYTQNALQIRSIIQFACIGPPHALNSGCGPYT